MLKLPTPKKGSPLEATGYRIDPRHAGIHLAGEVII